MSAARIAMRSNARFIRHYHVGVRSKKSYYAGIFSRFADYSFKTMFEKTYIARDLVSEVARLNASRIAIHLRRKLAIRGSFSRVS